MANDQIRFGVGFDVDKTSLNSLKASLEEIQKLTAGDLMKINTSNLTQAKTDLDTIRTTASAVQEALKVAFNQKLNTVNIETFNKSLASSNLTLEKIHQNFSLAGSAGTNAFRNLANQVTSTNVQLKQTHSILDKMATTLANTVKWNLASSAVNALAGSVQKAYGYVKALDGSLNDIQIVTQKSAEDMDAFAEKANKAAKSLGVATTDYTDASLTFYQQGLSDEEVEARTDLTTKVANASGLSADDAAEYVTAVLNGYKVGSEEAEAAMDVLANVGAHTASSLSELSEAMSKVSSTASTMGVSEEQLAASLATVIQTTRQDASTVGTAFKTIYMRISDIEAGTEDAEVSLGNYTSKMADLGINVLDQEGNLRDLGEVMEEVGNGWDDMSREQQIALARTMAGTRQANNLLALFDNWDDYAEALGYASNATGTLQQQQDIYMESTAAHLNELKASWENVYDSMLDSDTINTVADGLGGIGDVTAAWIDSIGGGGSVLKSLGSIAVMVFSKQIAASINTTISNFITARQNAEQLKAAMDEVQKFQGIQGLDSTTQELMNMKDSFYGLASVMSPEAFSAVQQEFTKFTESANLVTTLTADKEAMESFLEELSIAGQENFTLENLAENFDVIEGEISKTENALAQTKKELKGFGSQLTSSLGTKDFTAAADAAQQMVNSVNELYNAGNLSETAYTKLQNSVQNYNSALQNYNSVSNSATASTEEIAAAEEQLNNALILLRANITGTVSNYESQFTGMAAKIRAEASGTSESVLQAIQAAETEAQKAGISIQTALKNAAREEIIGSFTRIAGSITSITFAIQNLQNLGNIWHDEDLSTGEKILQTVTNLAMAIPMVISGVTGLVKGFKAISAAKKTYAAATTALAAAEGTEAAATTGAAVAQEGLNAAMLANPILLGIAALITAAAVAWSLYKGSVEAAAEAEKERLNTATDDAIAIEEEAENINTLYNNYKSLYNTFSDTGENEDELKEATIELADAFGIQIDTLDLLAGRYDTINKKILETREAQAKEALDTAKSGLESAEKNLMVQSSDTNEGDSGRRNIKFDTGMSNGDEDEVAAYVSKYLEGFDLFGGDYGNAGWMNSAGSMSLIGIKEEDFLDVYQQIQAAYEQMASELDTSTLDNSELYASIGSWLEDNQQYFDKYIQLQTDIQTYAQEFAEAEAALGAADFDVTEIESLDDYKTYRDQYIEQLRTALQDENGEIAYDEDLYESTDDYLNYLADEYLGTIDYISDYVEQANIGESLYDKIISGTDGADPSKVREFVDGLSGEQLELIATIGVDENATVEEVQKVLDLATAQAEESISASVNDSIATVMDSYSDDKVTSTDQKTYEAAQETLDAYLETTEGIRGMTTAMEEWSAVSADGTLAEVEYLQDLQEANTKTSEEIVEAKKKELQAEIDLKEVQLERYTAEAEAYQEELTLAEQAVSEAGENATDEQKQKVEELRDSLTEAQTKATETQSALEDLEGTLENTDWDLQIDLEGVESIESIGDSILNEADKIKSAAELIGEGFTVAADDADALAAVFPELLENATVTSNGIIQLDQSTVQALLGDQSAILDGDVDTCVAKIDNEIAVLEAKKASAEAELQLWQAVAQGELDIDQEALEAMAGGQEDFTNYLIQCGADANEADVAVKEAMAGNYDELARIATECADNMDANLVQGIQDAANNTQSNASNMITSLISVMNQAHQTAAAIAAMGSGEQAGSAVGSAGGGATGGKSFNGTSTSHNFNISDSYAATQAGSFVSDKISAANLDISSYTSAIAQLQALKAKLLANQKDANAALAGASNGTDGKTSDTSGSGDNDSDSNKEAEHIDELTDEADAYHDIDIEINQITSDLSKLQKQQEKLTGKDLLNNLNKQLDVLEKQCAAYNEKKELAQMEADAYKQMLASYGATFTDDGEIANYYTLMQNALNDTNAVIAWYNGLSADDQTDEAKQKVEDAKERYNNLKDLVSSYDTLINDTIPGLEEQIEDALYEEIEIKINEFDMEVELRLDMSEAERDWNEFKRKVIDGFDDDDLTGKAQESLANVSSYYRTTDADGNIIKNEDGTDAAGTIQTDTKHVMDTIAELNLMKNGGHSDIYSAYDPETKTWVDDTAAAEEDLDTYYKQLMSDLEDIEDEEEAVHDAFLDSIDAVNEAFDTQKKAYEFIGDQIEHDIKVMKLLYGDDAYSKMDGYYQKQIDNLNKELTAQQNAVTYWKNKMDQERELVAQGLGDEEALEKYEENWKSCVSNVNSIVKEWIETVTSEYENTVDELIENLNNTVSNKLGLDYLNEELDLLNDNAENYLDSINSAYAIQKLQNKWQDAINDTDSVTTQRELNDLMNEQIEKLEQKGELTQYDIDRAEKEYEIALKQIALEEAQQNKSKMRLKRDANGNYSYQYVSDEDSIREAQQELADLQNELYNFDKDAYTSNLNEMYSVWSEFQEKMAEVYKTYANDQEALEEHKALLIEQYGEKINYLTEQNTNIRNNLESSAFNELAGMYNTDVSNFTNMSNAEKDILMNDLVPQWDSGVQAMIDKFSSEGGFEGACLDTFDKLSQAASTYQGDMDDIEQKNQEASEEAYNEGEILVGESEKMIDEANAEYERIGAVIEQLNDLILKYKSAKEEAILATKAAYNFVQAQNQAAAAAAAGLSGDTGGDNDDDDSTTTTQQNTQQQNQNVSNSTSGTTASADVIKGIATAIWCEGNNGWGNDPGRAQKLIAKFNQSTRDSVQSYINAHAANGDLYSYWVNTLHKNASAYHYDKFKTGGLATATGPAWLDGTPTNPEMVLNADDTQNMLNALKVLENITSSLGANALDMIVDKLSGLSIDTPSSASAIGGDEIEQTVYITASFEGKTEAAEIQAALDNLVNVASQRAYRNKR